MRKPEPLRRGDRVALVAPAGRWDDGRLALGVELLESWGLKVEGPGRARPLRYMSAPDSVRAGDIARALADDEIRAVLAVRGGFGSARLHGNLDMAAVRAARRPKMVVGFSDITVLLWRLLREAGLVCYHGPMVAADLPRIDDAQRERFRRFLFAEEGWWDGAVEEIWRPGRDTAVAEGMLVGGCLSVLVTTLGTPYEIRTEGSVLFLEDVAEKPYRIDRMLTHLKHAGKLDRIAALVLGPMLDCDDGQGSALLRDIVLDVLGDIDVPVAYGIDAGHGAGNVVLPLGCRVRIDPGARRLELLEPAHAAATGATAIA